MTDAGNERALPGRDSREQGVNGEGAQPLTGKIAVVSGASRGIGRAYALFLADAGARVVGLARSVGGDPNVAGSLAEVVATARARGREVLGLACEVGDDASIARAVEQTLANFGGVDVLVNNAVAPTRAFDALDVPADEWEAAFAINVRGVHAFMRETIPHMITRGGGSIINITSGSAHVTKRGDSAHGYPAYAVTKAALERLTTYFAAEFADRNVAVNAISPGHVTRYIDSGREPEPRFWAPPLLHLAAQRPGEGGLTGHVLHTYQFGRSWGPAPIPRQNWDSELAAILRDAGLETTPTDQDA
jgi:NAD(P)-dependent dehydrogenase (short-subunit alcohol dehydrogenase family)